MHNPKDTLKRETILVVDDEKKWRNAVEKLLSERGGHRIILATNPSKARVVIREPSEIIDRVITDLEFINGAADSGLDVLLWAKTYLPKAKLGLMSSRFSISIIKITSELGAIIYTKDDLEILFESEGLIRRKKK